MDIVSSVREMKRRSATLRAEGAVIGFVPTMGYLHEGHLSLVRIAGSLADTVVASIFVNPAQFGPSEDFERYPRDLERDRESLEEAGAHVVFVPSVEEIYPPRYATVVHVQRMGDRLCGGFRPGHFEGVCTVVAKLLSIVRPSIAVFGQKDGQQVAIIERMVADLNMDVEIIRAPTLREPDGLAMSSRNVYLSPEERARAAVLYRALDHGRSLFRDGETDAAVVIAKVRGVIDAEPGVAVQYVAAVDSITLDDLRELRTGAMLAVAAHVGKTRLIDNVVLED